MILDPYQISGFIVGEGCFYIDISKDPSYNCGYQSRLCLEIELRDDDEEILHEIKRHLGCGNIHHLKSAKYHKWKPHVKFRVSNFRDVYEKVIPFFKRYPLFGRKKVNFDIFCEAAEILKNDGHKTVEGVEKLLILKSKINKYGK
jgi:hypothetical protein